MKAIEELATEVERTEIIASVEQAATLAASRSAGLALSARLDPETGILRCFASRRVVAEVSDPAGEIHRDEAPEGAGEGDVVEVPVSLGRASSSAGRAAREVLELRLRSARLLGRAARFRDRVGRLETGRVLRREGNDLIVDLGPVEGRLPADEQSRHEVFNPGDTIRASIRSIVPEDPPVILSRIAPEVLAGAIERETPEVRRGIVEVRAVARHPGTRAKAAVWTDTPDVDAVAACLGPGGSRIRAVTRELRGERVDVVRWSRSLEEFAANALRPARVVGVERSEFGGGHRPEMELIVSVAEAEVPRAVGKRGENVRLASELIGMPIQVVAEGQRPADRDRRGRGRPAGPGRRPVRHSGRHSHGPRGRGGPAGPRRRRGPFPGTGRRRPRPAPAATSAMPREGGR